VKAVLLGIAGYALGFWLLGWETREITGFVVVMATGILTWQHNARLSARRAARGTAQPQDRS
jgi:hypothetical protein